MARHQLLGTLRNDYCHEFVPKQIPRALAKDASGHPSESVWTARFVMLSYQLVSKISHIYRGRANREGRTQSRLLEKSR